MAIYRINNRQYGNIRPFGFKDVNIDYITFITKGILDAGGSFAGGDGYYITLYKNEVYYCDNIFYHTYAE